MEIPREKLIIVGNKIYAFCEDCRAFVQVNKFIFGSMHLCKEEK